MQKRNFGMRSKHLMRQERDVVVRADDSSDIHDVADQANCAPGALAGVIVWHEKTTMHLGFDVRCSHRFSGMLSFLLVPYSLCCVDFDEF